MFLLILICAFKVSGQLSLNEAAKHSNLLPPTPDAASFTKFGNLPIGISTGTAKYDIPIYTIKSGSLSHEIVLSYSSNGTKVDEIAPRTGLGWNLNAGGVINRTVMDLPDGNPGVFPTYYNSTPMFCDTCFDYYNYLKQYEYGGRPDFQPDEYSFNFGGYSGKFLVRQNGEFTQTTFSGLIIEQDGSKNFLITVDNGDKYYFNQQEVSKHLQPASATLDWFPTNAVTTWYLTKILSANGFDSIIFSYLLCRPGASDNRVLYDQSVSQTFSFAPFTRKAMNVSGYGLEDDVNNAVICPTFLANHQTSVIQTESNSYYLSLIDFNLGEIEFEYSDREDVPYEKKLDKIVVQRKSDNGIIKDLNLSYQYSEANSSAYDPIISGLNYSVQNPHINKRLFLEEVEDVSADQSQSLKTAFQYNDINSLPPRLSFSQDRFGSFNGKVNEFFFPNDTWAHYYMRYNFIGGDRGYDFENAAKGILTKISYPTGGYTQFEYEPNKMYNDYDFKYLSDSVVVMVDTSTANGQVFMSPVIHHDGFKHLRIKGYCEWATSEPDLTSPLGGVTDFLEAFNVTICVLNINTNECSSITGGTSFPGEFYNDGLLGLYLPAGDYKIVVTANRPSLRARVVLEKFWKISDRSPMSGVAGVRVKAVKDYSATSQLERKRSFYYCNWGDPNSSSGMGVDIDFNLGNELGIVLDLFDPPGPVSEAICGYNTIHSNGIFNSYLSDFNTVIYTKVIEIEETVNGTENSFGTEYEFLYEPKLRSFPTNLYWGDSVWYSYPFLPSGAPSANNDFKTGKLKSRTSFQFTSLHSNRKILEKVENHYSLDEASEIVDTIYVSKRLFQTLPSELSAKWPYNNFYYAYKYYRHFGFLKLDKTTRYTYVDAEVLEDETEFDDYSLIHFNPRSIKSTTSKGKEIVKLRKYPTDILGADPQFIVLSKLTLKNILNPLIVEIVTDNVQSLSSIRNYYSEYFSGIALPLKQTISIEGNTAFDNVNYSDYNDRGNIVQYTGKDGLINTIIWAYKGQYPVVHVIGATYATVSDLITNPSVLENPTDGQLDNLFSEIRTGAGSNVQVTTYKYIPLVGVKEITDINGKKMVYEYDGFNRLKVTRDNDNNIIKVHEYEYAP